jgi:hypothetical protein
MVQLRRAGFRADALAESLVHEWWSGQYRQQRGLGIRHVERVGVGECVPAQCAEQFDCECIGQRLTDGGCDQW